MISLPCSVLLSCPYHDAVQQNYLPSTERQEETRRRHDGSGFQPLTSLGASQQQQQQQHHRPFTPPSTATTPSTTTQLQVSIGLGPDEKAKSAADAEEKQLVPGVDYKVPNHEAHRLDRRSKLDEQCDAWFAQLLGDSSDKGCLRGPIADAVHQQLTQPVELYNEMEFPDPTNDQEWTPYVSTKLPWSVFHPAYGLEQFGLPVPRRNAEAWRHFDVAGMVATPIDGNMRADAAVDTSTLRTQLEAAGTWLDDDECRARLVYVNGVYCAELSRESAAARNYDSTTFDDDAFWQSPELQSLLQRLPDGWTDELPCPVPMQQGAAPLTSYQNLSKPNHKIGRPDSQFAINTQQGTACFAALNTIHCRNVAVVHETDKADDDDDVPEQPPILILNVVTPDGGVPVTEEDTTEEAGGVMGVACHPRTVIVTEEGTRTSVVQQSVTLEGTSSKARPVLYNGYTQVLLKDGANVTHSLIEEMGGLPVQGVERADDDARDREARRSALQNTVMEMLDVYGAGHEAHYSGTVLSMGGSGRTRMATSISLLKPKASCSLSGFSLTGGNCRSDLRTNIHHVADGCQSQQLQKNMVAGRATTSFRGRIRVEQSAQQTDSQQLSRTVLLTDKARAWAVPSLEIIADDVQCTHGATVSDLSEEELFYLRSRGLDVAAARNLLMYAFCNDVTTSVPAAVLGELKSLDRADAAAAEEAATREGLQVRILRRLQNLVPTGKRAVQGEFQSV